MTIGSRAPHRCKRAFKRRLLLESLEARHLLAADFGDAPAPYPVTLDDDGARHESVGPRLGPTRDAESNGVSSQNADGDGADEDGLLFGVVRPGQLNATVIVNVQDAPQGALLNGWVDFNTDGNWGGNEERIFANQLVVEGDNVLKFDVPSWTPSTDLYARFRVSTTALNTVTGNAADGEVEDHVVSVEPPVASTLDFSSPNKILNQGNWITRSLDLDQDGDVDFFGQIFSINKGFWAEQTESGDFVSHQFDQRLIEAVDIDDDSDIDFLATSANERDLLLLKNRGDQTFETISLGVSLTDAKYYAPDRSGLGRIADLDGDGDHDIAISVYRENSVEIVDELRIIEQLDNGWTSHVIGTNGARVLYDSHFADLDSDGDLDIAYATFDGPDLGRVGWYRNDGNFSFTQLHWTTTWGQATSAFPVDYDKDGDIDVLATGPSDLGDELDVFRQNADGTFARLIPQSEVTPHLQGGSSAVPADLTGDGNFDVVWSDWWGRSVGWMPHSTSSPYHFNRLASFGVNGTFAWADDVDNDGALDILVGSGDSSTTGSIYLITNTGYVTLDDIADTTMVNSLTIPLTGIGSNREGGSTLRITATSSDPDLIPDPTVNYESPAATGSLLLTRASGQAGTSLITVTVEDAGADGNINTTEDNVTFRRDFAVSVEGTITTDYGDAPAPYPVTLEENGARHESVGPALGLVRDSEVNGTHSANANSDGIDEDGVLSEFDLQATVGANPTVTMLVSNPTGSEAILAGWIDYDQDGSFEALERATAVVRSGTVRERVTLSFPDIPEGAAGNTFARFRFSTDASFKSNPSPVGLATDGEVEDYAFTIVNQTAGTVRKSVKLASLLNGVPAVSTGNLYHAPTTIGDFDGDGIDDLVVAARGLSGQNQPGSIYIHRMKEDGTVRETTSFSINSPNFGTDVTAAGDINGDGVTDVVVGSNVADGGNGAVFVAFLNSDGTLQSSTKIGTNLNGGPPLRDDDIFGISVTAIGDLDGDGVSEILVGANGDDLPADNNGVAYVLFLNRDGTAKRFVRLGEGQNGIPAGTLIRNDAFGYRVEAIGDLNQDGIPDLAIHAPGDDTGGPSRGAVYLLFLAADGTVQSHKKLASNLNGVPTLDDGDQLGRGLGVLSDLDGNGVRELAVGTIWNDTEGTDRGAIYILYMESDGTVSRHVRIADGVNGGPSLADGDKFGTQIASVGDLDGDGVHEIAVTALHDDSGNPNQGAVHVLFMNSAPTNPPSLDPIPDRSLDEDQKQIVLLVPAESPGRVDRIDAKTGTLLDSFGEGVLTSPTDVAIGPEGHYYVVDKTNKAVHKFDQSSYAYLGAVVGSLAMRDEIRPSLLVRENGNVLVSTGYAVDEYLNDGSEVSSFFNNSNRLVDIELGRDGSLIASRLDGWALHYSFPGNAIRSNPNPRVGAGGGVAFDASGSVFLAGKFTADSDNRLVIQKVGLTSVAEEGRAAWFGESEIFVTLPGLGGVTDIDFGPDHQLYLSDPTLNQIIVVDGQTGEIRQRLDNIDQNGHIALVTLPGLHPQDATIELSGIGDGDGGNQSLSVTAVSDNPSLIPNPSVDYMSNSDSGRLTIVPTADESGIANITVTVMDGGADDDLQTPQDNKLTLRTFQVKVDASASIAHDDTTVMWRADRDRDAETIHVPIGELLQNDFLGKYESVDDVTVTVPSQSKYGGSVELSSGTLTYQRPATYFPGVDEIVYTLDDGGHVSTATLYVLDHGPYSETWGIPLEPGRSHDVILMRNETQLTLLDRPTSSVIFEIPLKSLLRSQYQFREAHLMLAPEHENRVELRHLSAPNPAFDRSSIDEIELQTSIWAGASGLDQLTVTGRGQEWGDSNNGEIHGFGFFRFSGIGASDRSSYRLYDENGNNLLAQDLTIQNFENISSGRDNEPASYVDYGDRSFRFDSVFPYKFGNYSHLEGGLISSTSIMALDTGNVFEGFGVLDGRFAGAPGSMILPKGDLAIGNDESPAGFDTHGDLQIADHTVTLHDLNWAALGGLTSLGSSSKPGKLDAPNGLVIDFTDNVVGYGSVLAGTSEDPAVVMNNGWIAGDSEDRHITLAGLVKGVGSLTNVTINGIYSPGFSPALVRNGHVTYADQSTVLVELGGTIAGDQHDRIEHETARLSGTLQVELIDGFSPALGDAFKILTSELPFVGDFLAEKLPELPDSLTWIVDKSPTEVVLRIGFQSDGDVRIKRNKDDDLLLIDANGNELPTGDDRIRIVVDPADDFSDDRDWKIKDAELKNGLLIQTVTDGNHELEIQGADWTNFVMRADVSDDGEVTSRDALLIINELGRNSVTDLDTGFLRDPASFASWPGVYYDQTGDGRATSLDALRVINQLGRLDNAETGEAEAVAAPGMIWLPADTWAVEVSGGIIERADFAHAMSVPVRQAAADKFAIPAQHASPGESVGAVTSGDRILRTNNDVVDAVDLLLSDESSWIEGEV